MQSIEPEERFDKIPESDIVKRSDSSDFVGSSDTAERVYRTGDLVPWTASWKPSCGEAKRPLKRGHKLKFPKCSQGHPDDRWLDR
ncbi:hypothetical protein AB0F81_09630 [Actinoplanes sp. NPDC024001]|uniref:hypothetical protein n=1 Tax=Actinoplanes sp. NPDC024001 TaxID=3154598 RepID=UPI0033EC00A7